MFDRSKLWSSVFLAQYLRSGALAHDSICKRATWTAGEP